MSHHIRRPIQLVVAGAVLLVGPTALAACGDDSTSTAESTTTTAAGVTVTGAWARTSPSAVTTGAVYLTLTSATDDALTSVSVDPSVAAQAQLHETTMSDSMSSSTAMAGDMSTTTMASDAMSSTTAMGGSGQMSMQEVDKIELPAGKAVALKPGGYHIMLLQLAKPLEKGASIEVTLSFGSGASQTIEVPVRDNAP